MLNKTVLFTRPKHESTTSYLFYWSADLIMYAKSRFISVHDIQAEKVNRKEVSSRIKKMNPNYVHLNGHGSAEVIGGHNNEIILDSKNAPLLQNTIVYALSCQSASRLGPLTTSLGASAYIGYKEDFIFFTDNSKYAHPTQDDTAGLFLKPAMKISESILKGKTVEEAVKIGKDSFTESMLKAANSEVQTGHSAYIPYLFWNRRNLTYSGESKATI